MPLLQDINGKPPIFSSISSFVHNDVVSANIFDVELSATTEFPKTIILDWNNISELHWGQNINEFFIIDFKNYYVSLSVYGMRPYANDHSIQHWKILGSNNKSDWEQLDERDENICEGYMDVRDSDAYLVCKQSVEKFFSMKQTKFYKYIKVEQSGPNTMYNFIPSDPYIYMFYLASFEVYGQILPYIPSPIIKTYMSCKTYYSFLFTLISFLK